MSKITVKLVSVQS